MLCGGPASAAGGRRDHGCVLSCIRSEPGGADLGHSDRSSCRYQEQQRQPERHVSGYSVHVRHGPGDIEILTIDPATSGSGQGARIVKNEDNYYLLELRFASSLRVSMDDVGQHMWFYGCTVDYRY